MAEEGTRFIPAHYPEDAIDHGTEPPRIPDRGQLSSSPSVLTERSQETARPLVGATGGDGREQDDGDRTGEPLWYRQPWQESIPRRHHATPRYCDTDSIGLSEDGCSTSSSAVFPGAMQVIPGMSLSRAHLEALKAAAMEEEAAAAQQERARTKKSSSATEVKPGGDEDEGASAKLRHTGAAAPPSPTSYGRTAGKHSLSSLRSQSTTTSMAAVSAVAVSMDYQEQELKRLQGMFENAVLADQVRVSTVPEEEEETDDDAGGGTRAVAGRRNTQRRDHPGSRDYHSAGKQERRITFQETPPEHGNSGVSPREGLMDTSAATDRVTENSNGIVYNNGTGGPDFKIQRKKKKSWKDFCCGHRNVVLESVIVSDDSTSPSFHHQ